jgi:hypothetical protein
MTNKQDITAMSYSRDLTPGPSPKERGEGHDIWRQPPLSFGEGPGVRSLRLLYPLYVIYFSSLSGTRFSIDMVPLTGNVKNCAVQILSCTLREEI